MFFRFKRRFNLLSVDNTYARLKNITFDGDLEFEFRYRVKQLDVVKRNALTVRASIITKVSKRKTILDNSHRGHWNSRQIVGNILRNVSTAKTVIKERELHTIASRNSDITSKINNDILPRLRAGVPANQIPELHRTKLVTKPIFVLREKNETKPIFTRIAHSSFSSVQTETSASIEFEHKRVVRDMIIRQGIDPTHMFDLTPRTISSRNAFGGIVRPTRVQERSYDPVVRLLHSHVFNHKAQPSRNLTTQINSDQVRVQVAEVTIDDNVELPVNLTIPGKKRRLLNRIDDLQQFIVKFELLNAKNGTVIDTLTKHLDIGNHIRLYRTPKVPPRVNAVANELTSRVNLEIKQEDPGATSVNIYKKIIPRASVLIDDYRLIGNFGLTVKEQALNVQVDKPVDSPAIYRVIPVGDEGNISSEFTNVVVKPQHYKPNKAIALNTKSLDTGVEVEARSLPTEAISIMVMARDLTIHENDYRNVADVVTLVDEQTREADNFSIIDDQVTPTHVYEYVSMIIYRDGTSEQAGNAVHEHVSVHDGKVDITIKDLQVDNDDDQPNVSFVVNSQILDTDVDIIKSLLEKQGIKEFFNDELMKQRDFFKDLIAHNIQRVNLTTGLREDFGTVTNEFFNDRDQRTKNAVQPLRLGNNYRYEVSTLLRSPETLFEQFIKENVDTVTKKSYRFKPAKFLHPIALNRGTIVTATGLKTRFSKDAFAHGRVGSTEYTEVSFNQDPASIVELQAANFDRHLNVVTWKLLGNTHQVDHFVIFKDEHGVRTALGKTHSEFPFGNVQYLHELTDHDTGEWTYVVIPIFNDYDMGDEVISNAVEINQ